MRALCDEIWEELFESINAASCLRRHERLTLAYLWKHCKVRSIANETYPGHEQAAATLGISPLAVHAALVSLERKGLIRAVEFTSPRRRKIVYRLNAYLLECAYDKVRLKKTS